MPNSEYINMKGLHLPIESFDFPLLFSCETQCVSVIKNSSGTSQVFFLVKDPIVCDPLLVAGRLVRNENNCETPNHKTSQRSTNFESCVV